MDYDYLFKLVLTGCSSVGKTSLLHRFMDDEFITIGIPTIGVDFRIKQFVINGEKVKLQIWDSAGQDRFQCLTRQYYRNANALCMVYDVTDYSTFERTAEWLQEFNTYGNDSAPKYLVGNKIDLELKRQVSRPAAEEYAAERQLKFFETSAKSGEHVQEMFRTIAETLLASAKRHELEPLLERRHKMASQAEPTRRVRLTDKLQQSFSCSSCVML